MDQNEILRLIFVDRRSKIYDAFSGLCITKCVRETEVWGSNILEGGTYGMIYISMLIELISFFHSYWMLEIRICIMVVYLEKA